MPAWVGLLVTLLGMGYAGYNQFVLPYRQNLQIESQIESQSRPIAYCQIQIAYDPAINKHYFQHLDGTWREYPPTPY